MKKPLKDILYPFCSASPAHTTLADAPIRVPLPKERYKVKVQSSEVLPPRQAPNASVQMSGFAGRHTSGESASLMITGI